MTGKVSNLLDVTNISKGPSRIYSLKDGIVEGVDNSNELQWSVKEGDTTLIRELLNQMLPLSGDRMKPASRTGGAHFLHHTGVKTVDESEVLALVEMGFPRDKAEEALRKHNSVEAAVESLFG